MAKTHRIAVLRIIVQAEIRGRFTATKFRKELPFGAFAFVRCRSEFAAGDSPRTLAGIQQE